MTGLGGARVVLPQTMPAALAALDAARADAEQAWDTVVQLCADLVAVRRQLADAHGDREALQAALVAARAMNGGQR